MPQNSTQDHTKTPQVSDWIGLEAAERLSTLKKSRLYELVAEGEIRSFVLRAHKTSGRGRRLFSRSSIIDYLNRKAAEEGAL
jgi:hypothetical protein